MNSVTMARASEPTMIRMMPEPIFASTKSWTAPARATSPNPPVTSMMRREDPVAEARMTTDSCVTGIGAPPGGGFDEPAGAEAGAAAPPYSTGAWP